MNSVINLISTAATTEAQPNVDSITNVAMAMDNYGVVVVICSAFLLVVIGIVFIIMHQNKKNNDKVMSMFEAQNRNIMEQNQNLIEKLSTTGIKISSTAIDEEEKKKVNSFVKLNMILKDECKETQHNLSCIRVGIYVCHNGSRSLSGIPFFKATCVSEYINSKYYGFNGRMKDHSDLPLGIFYPIIENMYKFGYYYATRKEMESVCRVGYDYMCQSGANSIVVVPIYDKDENSIGSVNIEFENELENDEQIKNAIAEAKDLVEKVSPVLEFSTEDRIEQS